MSDQAMDNHRYRWPQFDVSEKNGWSLSADKKFLTRNMPEALEELSEDSQWPAFFPAGVSLVTAGHGGEMVLEREVGATIVNRFPYILALSFCKQDISRRHHPRESLMKIIEKSGAVAVQFMAPGASLDKINQAISESEDNSAAERVARTQLETRRAETCQAPVFEDSYMVYEGTLVKPGKDFDGIDIFPKPWLDVGSHRLYFFEITAIQLRKDIAEGKSKINWKSLPGWEAGRGERNQGFSTSSEGEVKRKGYQKGFDANYFFPTSKTTLFEHDRIIGNMAVQFLSSVTQDQIEVDNDRARWPCFFPSPLSFVTSVDRSGTPNIMPCGSTMVVSRHPMAIAVCISYAAINVRYRPRATLDLIRETGRFGCAVPYIDERVISAIEYAGNVTFAEDYNKLEHAGYKWISSNGLPIIEALPINFECEVVQRAKLGTHEMIIGEIRKIYVRSDVSVNSPLEWFPISNLKLT